MCSRNADSTVCALSRPSARGSAQMGPPHVQSGSLDRGEALGLGEQPGFQSGGEPVSTLQRLLLRRGHHATGLHASRSSNFGGYPTSAPQCPAPRPREHWRRWLEMLVGSGQERGPARRAERADYKGVAEAQALAGQAVDMGLGGGADLDYHMPCHLLCAIGPLAVPCNLHAQPVGVPL